MTSHTLDPVPAPAAPPDGGPSDGTPHDGAPPYPPQYAYRARPPGRFARFFSSLPAWAAPAGVAVCIGGGVAYTLLMDPTSASATTQPTCIMRLFTGFDCPGCGGTRSAWYLLHGDLPAAARHHAPLAFVTPFLAYMYVAWTAKSIWKKLRIPSGVPSNRVMIGFLGVWLVWSILRNLPWEPFTWLYV